MANVQSHVSGVTMIQQINDMVLGVNQSSAGKHGIKFCIGFLRKNILQQMTLQ